MKSFSILFFAHLFLLFLLTAQDIKKRSVKLLYYLIFLIITLLLFLFTANTITVLFGLVYLIYILFIKLSGLVAIEEADYIAMFFVLLTSLHPITAPIKFVLTELIVLTIARKKFNDGIPYFLNILIYRLFDILI